MSKQKISIVFDCGATNVRAVAVNESGEIVSSESYENQTRPDPSAPGYRIWDVDEIWDKMCRASRSILENIEHKDIIGVTVTTFGVDGVIFSGDGKMLYPMISWQCDRTNSVMANIEKYIPLKELYRESATLPFNFNTINKAIWFRENRPELLNKENRFLFAPSVFLYFLSGRMKNDVTMAGTSMMTSATERQFSDKILNAVSFPKEMLGDLAEPGDIIGTVTGRASKETGLPEGIPVIATGHDTQFAVFGSGADINQPVLSSGTWEILMVRSDSFMSGDEQLKNAITTELDPLKGYYNIGNQWIASGMLEWAGKTLYPEVKEDIYNIMIEEARLVAPGSNGIRITPKFYEESAGKAGGEIKGLKMDTTRGEIYRAMLESLSLSFREGLRALEKAGEFRTDSILCVGGGSKNRLWNQLRADISGVEIRVIDKSETTVLGASMFVMYAAGLANSPNEAREMIPVSSEIFEPSPNTKIYSDLFG
ncbi:MAG: L-fuculokinase [Bacteroidales bacterium]|nr:L-fuculokinase [Bacteroidales bacterium]